MEQLQELDAALLLALNGSGEPHLDCIMWTLSSRMMWLLPITMLLMSVRGSEWRRYAMLVALLGLTVLIADQVSSGIIKHAVERLRPTHNPVIAGMVHTVFGYRGGLYGFVSSHAANTLALSIVISHQLRSRWVTVTMMLFTLAVCYSRMYLGVHYPGDIAGGLVVGALAAWLALKIMAGIEYWTYYHWALPSYLPFGRKAVIIAIACNLAVVLLAGLFPYISPYLV